MSEIKINANPETFKVSCIEYKNGELKKDIEVFAATVNKPEDKLNVGFILEEYRKLASGCDEYYSNHRMILENFVSIIKPPFQDFIPSHIISFQPIDVNRRGLLSAFVQKITNPDSLNSSANLTDCFFKTDPSRSIKEGLTADHFVLRLPDKNPLIQNLLIVDDVIDKGDTVKIFLDKLVMLGKIDASTIIKMACIYNNRKMEKKNMMEWFKHQQKR